MEQQNKKLELLVVSNNPYEDITLKALDTAIERIRKENGSGWSYDKRDQLLNRLPQGRYSAVLIDDGIGTAMNVLSQIIPLIDGQANPLAIPSVFVTPPAAFVTPYDLSALASQHKELIEKTKGHYDEILGDYATIGHPDAARSRIDVTKSIVGFLDFLKSVDIANLKRESVTIIKKPLTESIPDKVQYAPALNEFESRIYSFLNKAAGPELNMPVYAVAAGNGLSPFSIPK